jgi:hypothetical protein
MSQPDDIELQRRIRLVVILDAAERAGLVPLPVVQLHAMAFFANVLSPVWQMPPLEGSLLKRRGGPYYPPLQRDLDRLVGMGVAVISNLGHARDDGGHWRLEGSYRLNGQFADRIIEAIGSWPNEQAIVGFMRELALAVSALDDDEIGPAARADATYSDPQVDFGSVVDFAEWRDLNYTANAANEIGRFLPGGVTPTSGEKLHLYVRHLHKRLLGGR